MVNCIVRKLLKDPLVHFVFLGFFIFIIVDEDIVSSPSMRSEDSSIVISDRAENLIVFKFKSNQGRLPNEYELKVLTEQYVREEVLVREAIKLGLNENDHVIRARLVELVESVGLANNKVDEPTEEELKQFARDNSTRYSIGGRFSIEQIYLGKEPSRELVSNIQLEIKNGTPPASLGAKSNFTYRFNHASKEAIISLFGGRFLNLLIEADLGEWSGPIASPAGVHLVKVLQRVEPDIPAIESIKHRLTSDWKSAQKRQQLDSIYEDYRSHYEVINLNGGDQ